MLREMQHPGHYYSSAIKKICRFKILIALSICLSIRMAYCLWYQLQLVLLYFFITDLESIGIVFFFDFPLGELEQFICHNFVA
jgi:hypothetical protein